MMTALSASTFSSFAQPATNSTSPGSNLWFNEFIFLPGGFRSMAKTISATNETFRLALRYIGTVQAGNTPPKLPDGLTQLDISNAQYQIFTWPLYNPPKPINFYGQVVDENNRPVAGATGHFEWDDTTTNKHSSEVTSDTAGLFALSNAFGISLDVSVFKSGYYSSRKNRYAQYFKYSQPNFDTFYGTSEFFKPDSSRPIVYYLRKIGVGAEALVTSQHGMRESFWPKVPKDGTPVKIDLLNQKTGDGPLEISQTKPDYPEHGGTIERLSPWDRAKLASATNWSVTMKISDGGLIEENDEFPFNPPETGYQPVIALNFQHGQTNWTQQVIKDYYIKFGSPPLYGQLQLETSINQATVILRYVINPDGSRNLEPKQGYFPSSSRWTH